MTERDLTRSGITVEILFNNKYVTVSARYDTDYNPKRLEWVTVDTGEDHFIVPHYGSGKRKLSAEDQCSLGVALARAYSRWVGLRPVSPGPVNG